MHRFSREIAMRKPNITIRVDHELHNKVKEASATESISIGEFVRQAIEAKFTGSAQTFAQTREELRDKQEIEWLKEQIEVCAKQLEACAKAHERDQMLMLELQAEKKTFYDENQKLKNQLSAPRIKLPKFLSFLSTS